MSLISDYFFLMVDLVSLIVCSVYFVLACQCTVTAYPRFMGRFIRECHTRKNVRRIIRGIAWLIYTLLAVLLPRILRDDLITMVGLSIYYILVGYLLYHQSKVGMIYQLGFMLSMYATQVISIFAAMQVAKHFLLELKIYAYMVILFKASSLIMVTILFRQMLKKRYVTMQSSFAVKGMFFVPLISMVLIFVFTISSDVFLLRYGYGWLLLYCILILVINIYCLYFWYDVSKTQDLKHKIELMKQQNELTHQFYADLESNYMQSRKVIHDIRNHLQALEQSQKLTDSHNYMEDLHQMLNALGMVYYTDNRMLNIILNNKLKLLQPEQFSCHLLGVRLGFLSEIDTTTIFANLLDNVLEAKKGNDDFWLQIQGDQIQDFCVIKLSNTTKETYVPGQSTKSGHEGIGLENVHNAVEKYNGEMQIDQKGQIFSITLIFPECSL